MSGKKPAKKKNYIVLKMFLITLIVSTGVSLISELFLSDLGIGLSTVVLLVLILIGIIYMVCLCLPILDGVMTALGRNDGYNFFGFAAMLAALVNTFGLVSVGAAWLIEKV